MYLFFFLFLLLLLLFLINRRRRSCIIKKIRCMPAKEKCRLLSGLIEPFGYVYLPGQDIFSSSHDAWQKAFGYTAFYDRAAPRLHMVFDCEPVYFDYKGRTWLFEFWKGQYGINTGAEIGLYHADRLLTASERKTAVFTAVSEEEMLPLSFSLSARSETIASVSERHWWLTAFRMGRFCTPSSLCMQLCIVFPDAAMAHAFRSALSALSYSQTDICVCGRQVCFSFTSPKTRQKGLFCRFRRQTIQWENYFFCKLFLFITRPFTLSLDRLLYLYSYLPFAFRHTVRLRRCKRRRL